MASPSKSKKGSQKASSKSRPTATSAISQPQVEDASHLASLSNFSPDGSTFAFLSLAVDKHRLRIFDTDRSQAIAEHVFINARVASLVWGSVILDEVPGGDAPPSKKKRKKRESMGTENSGSTPQQVVAVGLSNGTIEFFSPSHARIIASLSDQASTSPILSLQISDDHQTVYTTGSDGYIRMWDTSKSSLRGGWKMDQQSPYTSSSIRSPNEILVANHAIHLLSLQPSSSSDMDDSPPTSTILPPKPEVLVSFTGHASPVQMLQWESTSEAPPRRFASMASTDRVVSLWEIPPTTPSTDEDRNVQEGKIVASLQLDSDARVIAWSDHQRTLLLAVAASGKISIFPVPEVIPPPASTSRTTHKLASLLPRSTIVPKKKQSTAAQVVAATFVSGEDGKIIVGRIVGGVKPVFDTLTFINQSGDFITDVSLEDVDTGLIVAEDTPIGAHNKRYTESNAVVGAAMDIAEDEAVINETADLDVDMAEMSLGQRLTALSGPDTVTSMARRNDESDSERGGDDEDGPDRAGLVPAGSLTRTLIQALHSSDSKLLETCLAHSDPRLIQNTVRRMPPQLAVPLIHACTERLSRGKRGATMKGRGAGSGTSAQRGTAMVAWIRSVLAIHSAHLLTVPDLVARLAGLHHTLSSRMALQESLLGLNGRLDMVLRQIELRSDGGPTQLSAKPSVGANGVGATTKEVRRYVEGESEDEDEAEDMDVAIEGGDDEGSIEDVALGAFGSDDDEEDSDEEESDDDDEDDSDGPGLNGFIDDEAEEWSDEDEDDESE